MNNQTQGPARSRINAILDDNSFVEIGALVKARSTDFNLQEKETPTDGVITGYGVIDGNLVYVYSQESAILNGSIGEMHAKKISNLYDLALKVGAPIIGLIDCAGLRLQEATDALNGFGQIYLKQSLASGVIPQITAIYGKCGGGLALFPTLTDFTFMEEKDARLFVNSPNALEGNYDSKLDTATAKFQSEEVGLVDFIGDEQSIAAGIRQLITMFPSNNEDDMSYDECNDDLNRLCSEIANVVGDTSIVLSNIADNNILVEVKANYGKSMVTGFIKLNGATIGVVANRCEIYDEEGKISEKFDAVITAEGAEKASEFITFCDSFAIPILTLTNAKGFEATIESEKKISKAVGRLTYAFANATVPKVNVIIGEALGSAYVTMNSKSIGADIVFAWTTASVGMMDSSMAVKIIYADEISKSDDPNSLISEKAAKYKELQSSVEAAASRGYIDTIIEAQDTRKYVIAAFEMLFTKREDRPAKKHGTV